jgi:hypothetical protein
VAHAEQLIQQAKRYVEQSKSWLLLPSQRRNVSARRTTHASYLFGFTD